MEVRHNTSLLERALEHVVRQASIPSIEAEARAHEKMARAQGFRRMATGAALGLAAVGIGLGLWLAYPNHTYVSEAPAPGASPATTEAAPDSNSPAKETPPSGAPTHPQPPQEPPGNPDVVTTNYTIFSYRTVSLAGRTWEVTAGHFFENETDKQWKHAWCYTEDRRDGLIVKIDLANRESSAAQPKAPAATTQTLQKVQLSTFEALTLATKCPWLDKKDYTVRDFSSTPGQSNPFEPDETTYKLVGSKLVVEGSIGEDFLEKLRLHKFDTLEINSPGGLVDVAIEAGAWLRDNGKSVQISSSCLSACAFVLAGGVSRMAEPSAHIGVHRFYNLGPESPSDTEVAQELSSRILRHLENMGVDAELFHVMANTPSSDMFYIDRSRLIAWRLLSPPGNDPAAIRERFLMSSSSVWIHRGSVVGLARDGTRRTLRFLHTAPSLSKTSASRGSILFDGMTTNGKDYEGTAYVFHECGSTPLKVTGMLAEDGKSIRLTGRANKVDEKCSPTGTGDIEIRLDQVGLSSSPQLFADLAERGIKLPAGLKDADPKPLADIEGFQLTANSDFPGGDFETIKGVPLDQCTRSCARQARCVGFTYNTKVQWCFLKSKISTPVTMQDAVAGRKTH